MNDVKEELEKILCMYMEILMYMEVLMGFCEHNFDEKYITPILKCLESIYKLSNENYNNLDLLILKIDK